MRRRKLSAVIAVVLVISVLQAGFLVYSLADKNNPVEASFINTLLGKNVEDPKETGKALTTEDAVKLEKLPKQEVDTSSIKISSEIENKIKVQDTRNFDKNMNNYKKMLAALKVDKRNQQEIERLLQEGYALPYVLTAYDFLNENYGHIDELTELVSKKQANIPWTEIFKEYNEKHPEFQPRNFESGYLEKLMKESNLNADDIMIADRISQKGLKSFEELIAMRKEGKAWNEINTELGIVNTQEKLPRVAVTSGQVKKFVESSKLTEDQVIKALVIAQKTGEDENEVIKKVKDGKAQEEIYAESYEEKYK